MNTSLTCMGLIMDGNRRWARSRGLSVSEGHQAGYEKMQEVLRWAREAGISHAAVYAFSTENWNRAEEEVANLMKLFRSILEEGTADMQKNRVRVRFVGDRSPFEPAFRAMMQKMEEGTASEYDVTLHLLLSYGGRAEIVAAANALCASGEPITEDSFSTALWTGDMPEPDLVLRTGGEKRLSNFLPWQSTYSELFFSDTLWPDFSREEFDAVLAEFAARDRRHGK